MMLYNFRIANIKSIAKVICNQYVTLHLENFRCLYSSTLILKSVFSILLNYSEIFGTHLVFYTVLKLVTIDMQKVTQIDNVLVKLKTH